MAKPKTVYSCSFCGYQAPKWMGKCPDCSQWNTFYEETVAAKGPSETLQGFHLSEDRPKPITQITLHAEDRISTKISELDRVLGGGLVKGAIILVGGDPGIGKSTLALHMLIQLALQQKKVLYISGEESVRQTRMRAQRLGELPDNLYIFTETSLEKIQMEIKNLKPTVVVIDSIQTMYTSNLESAPGSVSQIREASGRLIVLAKMNAITALLIGHVTKEGVIAGPRVLEHMVDTVLYFEGNRGHPYRILRAVKNRFGATDEIGVFEMKADGLHEVLSPSELFLSERPESAAGSVVVASIEGTRPILVEIQALVAPTSLALPRRTVIGVDYNRASLLVAVLEKKFGLALYNQDIFLNIAGGVRLNEPGVDLGIITSIASSKLDKPISSRTTVCGEVGLTGEVRAVSQVPARVKEAARLGFTRCIVPKNSLKDIILPQEIALVGVENIKEAIGSIFDAN
jgi:DNA repair protein RadA/Sms